MDLEHLPAQHARQASMLTPPALRDARRARAARRKLRLDHLCVDCARRADTKEQLGRRAAMLAVLDPSVPTDRPAVHRAKGANTPRATRRSAWIASRASTADPEHLPAQNARQVSMLTPPALRDAQPALPASLPMERA